MIAQYYKYIQNTENYNYYNLKTAKKTNMSIPLNKQLRILKKF